MKRQEYKRPDRDELETMVSLGGIKVASWRFCGNPRRTDIIKKWCEEYEISIPHSKPKIQAPECEVLLSYLNQEGQIRSTSESLGVTDETIRRWMRHYKIRRRYDPAIKSARFEQFS